MKTARKSRSHVFPPHYTLVLKSLGCVIELCGFLDFSTTVGLGALDYRNPEQLITMATFTPHPQYSNTVDYDYAVITTTSPAILGGNVSERFSYGDMVGTVSVFAYFWHFWYVQILRCYWFKSAEFLFISAHTFRA